MASHPHPQRMMRLLNIVTLAALCLVTLLCTSNRFLTNVAASSSSSQLQFGMRASWNSTSLALEASEFFDDPQVYFRYMTLLNQQLSTRAPSDESEYTTALSIASSLLGSASLNVLRAQLNLRANSPAIVTYQQMRANRITLEVSEIAATLDDTSPEAQHQLRDTKEKHWNTCETLVIAHGEIYCGVQELDAAWPKIGLFINDASVEYFIEPTYEFDHIHPLSSVDSQKPEVNVILYADPTKKSYQQMHEYLEKKIASQQFNYILRPVSMTSISTISQQQPLYVQGYGVELAIKNMEYKVLDDSAVSSSSAGVSADASSKSAETRELSEQEHIAEELIKEGISTPQVTLDNAQIRQLDYQASQRILQSSNPLEFLRELSQNFPSHVNALQRIQMNETIRSGLERNSGQRVGLPQPGTNMFELNGVVLDLDDLDWYTLLTTLKRETKCIDELVKLGVSQEKINQLLKLDMSPRAEAEASQGHGQGGQDSSPFLINMDVNSPSNLPLVSWLNDIEKDARYKPWPASLMDLLQPSWPGQLKYVRKNIVTALFIIDPASPKGLEYLAQADFFVKGNAPLRMGFVFFIDQPAQQDKKKKLKEGEDEWTDVLSSPSAIVAKVYYHLRATYEQTTVTANAKAGIAFEFLQALHDANPKRRAKVTKGEVESTYASVCKKRSARDATPVAKILTMPEYDALIKSTSSYLSTRGFTSNPSAEVAQLGELPIMIMNGQVHRIPNRMTSFRDTMMQALMPEQHKMVMKVYRGEISDRTPDIFQALQSKQNVYTRVNPEITSLLADMKWIESFQTIVPTDTTTANIKYLYSPNSEYDTNMPFTPITIWLATDLTTERGVADLEMMLQYLEQESDEETKARVSLLFTNTKPSVVARVVSALLYSSLPRLVNTFRVQLLHKLMLEIRGIEGDENKLASVLDSFQSSIPDAEIRSLVQTSRKPSDNLNPAFETAFIKSLDGLVSTFFINGRVISLTSSGLNLPDLRLASEFTMRNFGGKELEKMIVQEQNPLISRLSAAAASEIYFHSSFLLLQRTLGKSSSRGSMSFPPYDSTNVDGMIVEQGTSSSINFRVAIDPLSKQAQKLSSLLLAVKSSFSPSMQIWLTPRFLEPSNPEDAEAKTEMPLKRYYRYSLATGLTFNENGRVNAAASGSVSFGHLSPRHVLSNVMHTPESWQIRLEESVYDLDNLNVKEIAQSTTATKVQYVLEHLLMFGQCFEISRTSNNILEPPAGLQLMIGSTLQPFIGDTLVMQNLGYFQLKANPGEWTLEIADARHAEIYEIQRDKNIKDNPDLYILPSIVGYKSSTRRLFVRSFNDGFIRMDVLRRTGMEKATLLEPKKKASGLWSAVNAVFGGGDSKKPVEGELIHNVDAQGLVLPRINRTGETIHVFSLASGHLYERFLKIMMLSVLQSTNNPVKFWFLLNFLSPQFVDFVPLMAEHYGFEVEFVTYKWPLWLRRQEEKQRIIWGYKILFLDVLFPLAVPRIIYIDADQVVRGNIAELWHMDLKGAPYGYTPFCDSNTETEGFRFWKSGYWKDHLRGKPYHISALYVVDLDVFRRMRAGDSLRGIYDQLSADPGSLANLDQDLPNYAQQMVPIYSLPQQWLWCQTWCSMDTLPQAKTIDLCNNPLTKTPKLDVAKQLLPEWIGLDAQAKAIDSKLNATVASSATTSTQTKKEGDSMRKHEEL